MDEITAIYESLKQLITDNPGMSTTLGSLVTLILGSGLLSFKRRAKTVSQGKDNYFKDTGLLKPPMARPAYSDRMAYVLAEMSSLAYYEFEGHGGAIKSAAKDVVSLVGGDEAKAGEWLEKFADELLLKGIDSETFLRKVLKNADFELLGTVNVGETQAFVCKRDAASQDPYIVVAYRGTEKKTGDWLTDVKAVPIIDGDTKVHTGFHEALNVLKGDNGMTALETVKAILAKPGAKDANGKPLPLFITGHSLGGALAVMTTKELAYETDFACYTYGAPRVANYEYFRDVKCPIFRVVNSADLVPRVPPGAIMGVLVKVVHGLSVVTAFMPVVSNALNKLEFWMDKLNGYRHFGDQRYLTDVKAGRFDDVQLLTNPPAIDRLVWMGEQLRYNWFSPVKSHGMAIYRRKLKTLAIRRN